MKKKNFYHIRIKTLKSPIYSRHAGTLSIPASKKEDIIIGCRRLEGHTAAMTLLAPAAKCYQKLEIL